MNMRQLVSVITRTKNRSQLLARAKQSVMSQTYSRIQWVLINDGGERPESDFFQGIEESIESFVYIENPHSLGMEAASNKAIRCSNGVYVLIHDDDDTLEHSAISEQVAFLEAHGACSGVVCDCRVIEEFERADKYEILSESVSHPTSGSKVTLLDILANNTFSPISFMYTREAYEKVGGYDESLAVLGDWDFNLRFLNDFSIGYLSRTLSNYHIRREASSLDNQNSVVKELGKHFRNHEVVINKYISNEKGEKYPRLGTLLLNEFRHKQLQVFIDERAADSKPILVRLIALVRRKLHEWR